MTTKVLPLILAATIGLTSSIAFSGSAHAGNPNQPPCTAGPLCKDEPHNPGGDNPDPGAGVIPVDAMIIGCRVWADPKPTPDDLKFRNIGGKTIPAGTRVYWLVKATGDHGYYYPPVDILPGDELPDLDVLKKVATTADGCRSMIM